MKEGLTRLYFLHYISFFVDLTYEVAPRYYVILCVSCCLIGDSYTGYMRNKAEHGYVMQSLANARQVS